MGDAIRRKGYDCVNRKPLLCTITALALVAGCAKPAPQPPASAPTPSAPAPAPAPATLTAPPTAERVTGAQTDVRQVRMPTASAVWLQTVDRLLHSADGGRSWIDVSPKAGALELAYFPDEKSAWVWSAGDILTRSRDAGHTWQTVKAPFPVSILSFADEQHGWAMVPGEMTGTDMPVQIYATTDGGGTWTKTKGAPPVPGHKTGIAFRDANVGWVTGAGAAAGKPYLYRTKDGGNTWQAQPLPMPATLAGAGAEMAVDPPALVSGNDVIMPVRVQGGGQTYFVASHDGGETWTAGAMLAFNGVCSFADPAHGWYWDGKALQVTADGGKTWTPMQSRTVLEAVQALAFGDTKNGIAMTRSGLLRTEDGGTSWTGVTLP
jgi:photosystem II stability/assembly factor-like uncharacterized protein